MTQRPFEEETSGAEEIADGAQRVLNGAGECIASIRPDRDQWCRIADLAKRQVQRPGPVG